MSPAVIVAVNWIAEIKVVVLGKPFHLTSDPDMKPPPFTVRVNAGPPATAVDGTKPVGFAVSGFI